jgi:hypothetical protein
VGRRGFGCCDRVAASFEARRLRGADLVGARRGVVGVTCVAAASRVLDGEGGCEGKVGDREGGREGGRVVDGGRREGGREGELGGARVSARARWEARGRPRVRAGRREGGREGELGGARVSARAR